MIPISLSAVLWWFISCIKVYALAELINTKCVIARVYKEKVDLWLLSSWLSGLHGTDSFLLCLELDYKCCNHLNKQCLTYAIFNGVNLMLVISRRCCYQTYFLAVPSLVVAEIAAFCLIIICWEKYFPTLYDRKKLKQTKVENRIVSSYLWPSFCNQDYDQFGFTYNKRPLIVSQSF